MVGRLIRIRYGVVAMPPQLKRGQMIELEHTELQRLLQAAGMGDAPQGGRREPSASELSVEPGNDALQADDAADDVDGNGAGVEAEEESDEALDEVNGN